METCTMDSQIAAKIQQAFMSATSNHATANEVTTNDVTTNNVTANNVIANNATTHKPFMTGTVES